MPYVYNPGEPFANPFQPYDGENIFYFGHLDIFSAGRCGECGACPKIWKLTVPSDGSLDAALSSGDFYLYRNAYVFRGSFSSYKHQNCAWQATDSNKIPGQADTEDREGWTLIFMLLSGPGSGLNWYIITPVITDIFGHLYQSLYEFRGNIRDWSCLGTNTFRYAGSLAEFDYPYLPDTLQVVPFYA